MTTLRLKIRLVIHSTLRRSRVLLVYSFTHSNISLLSRLNKVKCSVSTLVKKFCEFKQIKTFTGLSLLSLLCFVFLN